MYKNPSQKEQATTFRHFSRKNYAVFSSLGRSIRIGVLATSMLTYANTESFAAMPVHQQEPMSTDTHEQTDDDAPTRLAEMLMEGDLLFEIDNSPRANAVTEVTTGVDGLRISHVAIAVHKDNHTYALEAIGRGVVLTPIDSFIARPYRTDSIPCIAVGRLKDRNTIGQSVRRAMRQLGKPYDVSFLPGNDAYYCSELVYESYLDEHGEHVFSPVRMTFCDRPGHIADLWQEHFRKLGIEVPEGVEGTNPGDLSKSNKLDIIYLYY